MDVDGHENGEPMYKGGLTTEQALKILHEDIETVVLKEELKFANERCVCNSPSQNFLLYIRLYLPF